MDARFGDAIAIVSFLSLGILLFAFFFLTSSRPITCAVNNFQCRSISQSPRSVRVWPLGPVGQLENHASLTISIIISLHQLHSFVSINFTSFIETDYDFKLPFPLPSTGAGQHSILDTLAKVSNLSALFLTVI